MGCEDDALSGVLPRLEARAGSKVDTSGRADHLVEFGEVPVGSVASNVFFVRNAGLAKMTLEPLSAAAPFGSELRTSRVVEAGGTSGIAMLFAPTAEGPAETVVTIESDGGSLRVRLVGTGRAPQPTDCSFDFAPRRLDFGVVGALQEKRLELRIVNKGENPCEVKRLTLDTTSDAGFSIEGGAVASHVIGPFDDYTVAVLFRPARFAVSFTGSLKFGMGPPDASQQVPLVAASPEPCPGALPDGSCPVATEQVYVNDSKKLYKWDPVSNVLTALGTFSTANGGMTDVAIDSNGTMLGCDMDKHLYVINPLTAETSRLATMANDANGLTFLPDGRLVASGTGVWSIDRATGAVLETLVPPGRYETSGDIIGLPDGKLYWVVRGGGTDRLVRIDPANGQTTVVGGLSLANLYGIGFADGALYGFGSNSVISVDPATATTSQTRTLRGVWWGATTNPVRW
jgi:hypothetical protein